MNGNQRAYIPEVFNSLGSVWQGALISAGLTAGIFDCLSTDTPIDIGTIAEEKRYDRKKLDIWFYYFEEMGFMQRSPSGYTLTDKGSLLKPGPETKEISGMLHLTEYYMRAAVEAGETFKTGKSLDKLTEGKISREYQPKVSDTFSHALVEIFKDIGIVNGESILDIGCGNGSMLRQMYSEMPDIVYSGVDKNLFSIERGRKQNKEQCVHNKITLLLGDICEDAEEFPDNSYDWVTAINVFHFIPESEREKTIDNMLRVALKGVIFTEVMVETSNLSHSANALMALLWNDFSGFFQKKEIDALNESLLKKYPEWTMDIRDIMHGNSSLLIMKHKV